MARVIVLAGPSGSGKSRLAERLGLPVLRLDDFYRDAGDPALPRISSGANAGIVDWDDPASWLEDEAFAAIEQLCTAGGGDVPVYDIAHDGRTGWQHLDLAGSAYFVAEGIFAQEIVPRAREAGLLGEALCITHHPAVTFWRRLVRDLREHRKPPLVLVRRGLALMRAQARVVAHAEALGCRAVTPAEATSVVHQLMRAHQVLPTSLPGDVPVGLRQPDARSCGAACVVVAGGEAASETFADDVVTTHRRLTRVRLHGRVQLPWPRAIGTPPWAVARELTALTGVRHRTRVVRWSHRAAPDPGAVYVGSRWLPRHVVLALPGEPPRCYEPASGRVVPLDGRPLGGWRYRWLTVTPTARRTPA